jgi:hypothetical protein
VILLLLVLIALGMNTSFSVLRPSMSRRSFIAAMGGNEDQARRNRRNQRPYGASPRRTASRLGFRGVFNG